MSEGGRLTGHLHSVLFNPQFTTVGDIFRVSDGIAFDPGFNQAAIGVDYNRAEQILAEQAPIAPIYQYTNGRLIKPWVKGYPITNPEDVAYSCRRHLQG